MKLKYRFGHVMLGITICMTIVTPVSAKTVVGANREWVRTAVQDQVNQGHLDKAIEILREHLEQDGQDSESWARLALLQSRTLKCEEAQASLVRASTVAAPGMRSTYLTTADYLRTKGCQAPVSEVPTPSASPDEQAGEWGGSARVRIGYDSNVMLLSDSVTTSKSPASAFWNPLAQVEYRRVLGNGQFDAQSVTSYTDYLSSDVNNFDSLSQSVLAEWEPKGAEGRVWDRKFGNRFDGFFVNSDGMRFFSWVNTAYAQFSRSLNESSRLGFEIPVGYQKFAEDTALTAADRRDGAVLTPNVWYARRFEKFVWNTVISYSQVIASGENYRMRSGTVSTGLSGNLAADWRARGNVSFSHNDYYDNPLNRKDNRTDLVAGLIYTSPSRSNLSFGLDLFATNHRSNLDGASYKRTTVMGQVDYAF